MINNNSENDFINYLLQFFTIMYFLDTNFEDFMHNDLHIDNILVRKGKNKKYEYNINNLKIVYKCDFELLLNDFGMSTTKKMEKNITSKGFKRDRRYDIFKFINTFYNRKNKQYKKVDEFIESLCHQNILKAAITYDNINLVKSFSLQVKIETINEIYPFLNIEPVEEILKNKIFKEFVIQKISF